MPCEGGGSSCASVRSLAIRGVGVRTTRRRAGATGRGGAFTSPTTMVVAEGADLLDPLRPPPWPGRRSVPSRSCRPGSAASARGTPLAAAGSAGRVAITPPARPADKYRRFAHLLWANAYPHTSGTITRWTSAATRGHSKVVWGADDLMFELIQINARGGDLREVASAPRSAAVRVSPTPNFAPRVTSRGLFLRAGAGPSHPRRALPIWHSRGPE
jgi:hypothetical protein